MESNFGGWLGKLFPSLNKTPNTGGFGAAADARAKATSTYDPRGSVSFGYDRQLEDLRAKNASAKAAKQAAYAASQAGTPATTAPTVATSPVVTGAGTAASPTVPTKPVVDSGFSSKLDPNDPAAIGGALDAARIKAAGGSQPAFNPTPQTTPATTEIGKAYEDPSKLPDFFGKQFEGVLAGQQEVTNTRASLPTSSQDLTTARSEEGYADAYAKVQDVNKRVADLNGTIANLEADVRKDLGPEVSESFIQAEVKRRLGDLEPVANRLMQEQTYLQTNLQMAKDAVDQRYNAHRADAAETLNRVSQALGFKGENMNTAMNLFTNLKQFELINDQQKDARRDSARATVSMLLASPRGLRAVSDADLQTLEEAGNLPAGVLKDIRDSIKENATPIFQNVDDAGNLNMLLFDSSTGTFTPKHWNGFATIVPKATTASATVAKLFSNATTEFRTAFKQVNGLIAQAHAVNADNQPLYNALQRSIIIRGAISTLGQVAAQTGNAADYEAFRQLNSTYGNTTETTADRVTAELDAVAAAIPDAS